MMLIWVLRRECQSLFIIHWCGPATKFKKPNRKFSIEDIISNGNNFQAQSLPIFQDFLSVARKKVWREALGSMIVVSILTESPEREHSH